MEADECSIVQGLREEEGTLCILFDSAAVFPAATVRACMLFGCGSKSHAFCREGWGSASWPGNDLRIHCEATHCVGTLSLCVPCPQRRSSSDIHESFSVVIESACHLGNEDDAQTLARRGRTQSSGPELRRARRDLLAVGRRHPPHVISVWD